MANDAIVTLEPQEGLWDAHDVAAYLKASRSWVYQKAEAGVLPSLRVCGLLRFEPAAIRAYARGNHCTAAVVSLPVNKRGSSC